MGLAGWRTRTAVTGGLIGLLAFACSRSADKPADAVTGEAPAMAEAAAATLSLSDFAGSWTVHSRVKEGKGHPIDYRIVATDSRDGWTVNFPNREPIPLRIVAAEGDSIVTEAGLFESALRKGVQVRTRGVTRLVDGKMVGTNWARYEVGGPDTLTVLEFEGTRAP